VVEANTPAGMRIWIAAGITDLRRGFTGLSGMVQTTLQENPFSGHVLVFRGRRGDLIKLLWWSGDGLCLFAKREMLTSLSEHDDPTPLALIF